MEASSSEGFLCRKPSTEESPRFGVTPRGDSIEVFDVATGERLRSPEEEVAAREAAEAEVARLRAEIERLKGS